MESFLLSKESIAQLLPMNECISVVEKAFLSLAKGNVQQPLRNIMWLPDKYGAMGMMPCIAPEIAVMGIKVLSVFPNNKNLGLSSHQGCVILFETKSGKPLCIADADEITAIRTAAASAVATRLLSRKNSEILAVLGSGTQAFRHLEAMLLVRNIKKINLWSRNKTNAKKLAELALEKLNVQAFVKDNVKEAVKDSDIICTVTASPDPVLKSEWIKVGTHINAVGSCTPQTRELDTETLVKCKLYTDRYESLFNEAGDFLIPKKEGKISDSHAKGEIGELLAGKKTGRENETEMTVFKSLGIAVEDIYSVHHVYTKLTQQFSQS